MAQRGDVTEYGPVAIAEQIDCDLKLSFTVPSALASGYNLTRARGLVVEAREHRDAALDPVLLRVVARHGHSDEHDEVRRVARR